MAKNNRVLLDDRDNTFEYFNSKLANPPVRMFDENEDPEKAKAADQKEKNTK